MDERSDRTRAEVHKAVHREPRPVPPQGGVIWRVEIESSGPVVGADAPSIAARFAEPLVAVAEEVHGGVLRIAVETPAERAEEAAAIVGNTLEQLLHDLDPARAGDDHARPRKIFVVPALEVEDTRRAVLHLGFW